MLNAEEKANARFDKKLAQEELWIRQGIKARRTRNEGRVRALKSLRQERSERRNLTGKVAMKLQDADRSGKLVLEAEHLSYSWGDQSIIKDFSTTIMRGDRIGLIGPNGSGKTTLLNLLLGKLQPDEGEVQFGTKLEVAYFDQLRATLDEEKSVRDNVADGSDKVEVNGYSKHVISYLQDFLFAPDRVRQPVKALSGGERNRLLLAKLFTRPANMLVMDEPTNDLDMETLELLEELLLEFKGTLLLVSHDRAFLDNVVTSTLVLEGGGRVAEYVGGYEDWIRQRRVTQVTQPAKKKLAAGTPVDAEPDKVTAKKLSYKDQRDLDALPARIDALEREVTAIQQTLADPALYQGDPAAVSKITDQLQKVEAELEVAYGRWDELESN